MLKFVLVAVVAVVLAERGGGKKAPAVSPDFDKGAASPSDTKSSHGSCGGCSFPWLDWNNVTHYGCTDFDGDDHWCGQGYEWGSGWEYCTDPSCPGLPQQPTMCMADKAPRKLTLLEKIKRVGSWEECRDMCHDNTQCEYFQYKDNWNWKKRQCVLMEMTFRDRPGYITGPPTCTDLCHSCSTYSPCPTGCTCNMGCCDCGEAPATTPPYVPPTMAPGGSVAPGGGSSNASYCAMDADHTMCQYPGPSAECSAKTSFRELSAAAKAAILDRHNELRRRVAKGEETGGINPPQPQAANMRKLVWSDELEAIAQRWSDQCTFGHDSSRNTLDGTYVGQNAYYSATSLQQSEAEAQAATTGAADAWYDEVTNPGFDSQSINPFVFSYGAGHYTQVVWADTEELGCGMVHYTESPWYKTLVVCNYGQGGNWQGGEMYQLGAACSACPAGYTCDDGLCASM